MTFQNDISNRFHYRCVLNRIIANRRHWLLLSANIYFQSVRVWRGCTEPFYRPSPPSPPLGHVRRVAALWRRCDGAVTPVNRVRSARPTSKRRRASARGAGWMVSLGRRGEPAIVRLSHRVGRQPVEPWGALSREGRWAARGAEPREALKDGVGSTLHSTLHSTLYTQREQGHARARLNSTTSPQSLVMNS